MKKCIYKITNLINGKMYIGQTNDFNRRKREHKNKMYGNCSKVLYNAIEKYGWDNFSMEIIENYCENYCEKEKYWTDFYNCYVPNGYNIDLTLVQSENNIYIDEQLFYNIVHELKNSEKSYQEIADMFDISSAQSIRNINRGITHKHSNIEYPIRKSRNDIAKERTIQVISDLKNTSFNFSELAEKYNCSITCISNINTGYRNKLENEQYPIRPKTRKGQKFTEDVIDEIYYDIINTNLKWTELSKKYNCGEKVFQHINQGKEHFRKGYEYPLRLKQNRNGSEKALKIIDLLKNTDWTYKKIAEELRTNSVTVRNINNGKSHYQINEIYPIRNK